MVAVQDHRIAGFCALHFLRHAKVELEALFVDPDFIGQGLGKFLLNFAKATAKEHGAISMRLHSDPYAEDFYSANGAEKVGEIKSGSIPGRFLPVLEISL